MLKQRRDRERERQLEEQTRPPLVRSPSKQERELIEKDKRNVKVAVRVRPMNALELDQNDTHVVDVKNGTDVILRDPKVERGDDREQNATGLMYRSKEALFQLDAAFSEECSSDEVYLATCKETLSFVLNGVNGTVFAYGATGSGKTYTMSGESGGDRGIISLCLEDLFLRLSCLPPDQSSTLRAHYLEIYNEQMRDLLNPASRSVALYEDPAAGVTVTGMEEVEIRSAADLRSVLERGAANRTVDSHRLNEASSRSHAILTISVAILAKVPDSKPTELRNAKLSLIDLAGSERAHKTRTNKKMRREGAEINKSLLALANCINALSHRTKHGLYVPFRDSKLTRILKDSLR
jgi:kinesin family protein 18/19